MAPRPRCVVCNSKRWHRDAISGSIVCEEGHLLQGYVQESHEIQSGPSQFVSITRRVRKRKGERKERVYEAKHDHFQGQRASFLLVQGSQYILRCQLEALVREAGVDERVEAVGRDLWLMLMSSQEDQIPDAPGDFARGDEPPDAYSGAERNRYKYVGKKSKKAAKNESDDEPDEDARTDESGEAGGGRDEDSDKDEDDEAEEEDEDEEDDDAGSTTRGGASTAASTSRIRRRRKTRAPSSSARPKRAKAPRDKQLADPRARIRMEHTLLICYLACLTLKQPVTLADILHLAQRRKILYLDAPLFLPADMIEHANVLVREHLSNSIVPLIHGTYATTWRQLLFSLVRVYAEDWSVTFPEPNVPLVVARYVRELGLPARVYVATKRLMALSPPVSMTVPFIRYAHEKEKDRFGQLETAPDEDVLLGTATATALKASWQRKGRVVYRDPRGALPEMVAIAFMIIAFKTLYYRALEKGKLDDWLDRVHDKFDLRDVRDPSCVSADQPVDQWTCDDMEAYLAFVEERVVPVPQAGDGGSSFTGTGGRTLADAETVTMLSTYFPAPPRFDRPASRTDTARSDSADDVSLYFPRGLDDDDDQDEAEGSVEPDDSYAWSTKNDKAGNEVLARTSRDRMRELIELVSYRLGYCLSDDIERLVDSIVTKLDEAHERPARVERDKRAKVDRTPAKQALKERQAQVRKDLWDVEVERRDDVDELWKREKAARGPIRPRPRPPPPPAISDGQDESNDAMQQD